MTISWGLVIYVIQVKPRTNLCPRTSLWDLLYERPCEAPCGESFTFTVGLQLPSGPEAVRPFLSFLPGFCLEPTLRALCGLPFVEPVLRCLHLQVLRRSLSGLPARSRGSPFHGRGT